jgi:hypothetical protein
MGTLGIYGSETKGNQESDRRPCVVLYARDPGDLEVLGGAVAGAVPGVRIESFHTTGQFGDGLRALAYNCNVAVVVASGTDELREIFSLRNLLWGLRTIVILPDGDEEAISLAHGLRPRFVSIYGDGFVKVIAVLNKMLEDYSPKSSTD